MVIPMMKRARSVRGISKVEMHERQTLATGSKRRVIMTDGSVLEEEILAFDPPGMYRYGWTGGLKFPFSLLVRSGGQLGLHRGGRRHAHRLDLHRRPDVPTRLSARHSDRPALQRLVATGARRPPRRDPRRRRL